MARYADLVVVQGKQNNKLDSPLYRQEWAIPFNIGTPPIEGSGYPMGEGGCIVKFSKGVTQRIFLKGRKMISKGG